jgi:hypothetical protein
MRPKKTTKGASPWENSHYRTSIWASSGPNRGSRKRLKGHIHGKIPIIHIDLKVSETLLGPIEAHEKDE